MIKAMFIEDRPLTLQALQTEIKWNDHGIEPVAFCSTCSEAIKYVIELAPDVIVTDIVMPGIGGLEFCKTVNEVNNRIKLIIISAYSKFEFAKTALQLGVFDYLEKPLNFDLLLKTVQNAGNAKKREDDILEHIEQNRTIYIERFFTKLLTGNINGFDDDMEKEMVFLGISFSGLWHSCVTVSLDAGTGGRKQREMIYCLIFEEAQAFFGQEFVWGPFYLNESDLTFIISSDAECYHDSNCLQEYLSGVIHRTLQSYGVSICIGVGNQVKKISQLNQSCASSVNALEYRTIFGSNQVFYAAEMDNHNNQSWAFLLSYEEDILRHLSVGDENKLHASLKLLREFAQSNRVDIASLKSTIISVIAKTENMSVEKLSVDVKSVLDDFYKNDQLRGCLDRFEELCIEMCRQVQKSFHSNHHALAHKIERYIDDHYCCSDLNLTDIARHVNLSPHYVSTIFNKCVGNGITEYINHLRVKKSKQMLRNAKMRISEISEAIGYSSQYYYSINFKKITGVSPMEYRKKILSEEMENK